MKCLSTIKALLYTEHLLAEYNVATMITALLQEQLHLDNQILVDGPEIINLK